MSGTIHWLNDSGFDAVVSAGSGLVAVEFTAQWCGACQAMAPALEDIARELAERVRFFQIDADTNERIVSKYVVRGLPTVLIFRDGQLVERIIGAQSRRALRARFHVQDG